MSDHAGSAPRTCYECRFAYHGEAGILCAAYYEFVNDEVGAARDCPLYERLAPAEPVR